MRLYLSGPMTGLPGFNFPAFRAAARALRARGHDVVNPAENHGGRTDLPRHVYMRTDLEHVLTVDAVVVLPGWEASRGSTLEVAVARELGLPILTLDLEPVDGRCRLVGLNGRMRSGKDTVCAMLRELDPAIERRGFADKLKASAAAALGVSVAELEAAKDGGGLLLEHPDVGCRHTTVRSFLQRYGTEAHRDIFGPGFWVDHALADLPAGTVVFTDVRFPNEAEAIRARGGVVVRVNRTASSARSKPGRRKRWLSLAFRPVETQAPAHASEQKLDSSLVDYELWNNGSLLELRDAVASLYEWLTATPLAA